VSGSTAPFTVILSMGVSVQIHAPVTLLPGKYPQVTIEQAGGWVAEPVLTLWRRVAAEPGYKDIAFMIPRL
jgi:hypothetical protein